MGGRGLANGAADGVVRLDAAWACLRRWLRVVWVCRAPAASVIAGLVLFNFVAQGRDLFLDFPGSGGAFLKDIGFNGARGVAWYAFRFAALVLLLWALPVHAVARLTLNRSAWLISPYAGTGPLASAEHAMFARPVAWIPRTLAVLCFAAPLFGVLRARNEMLDGVGALAHATTERATAMLEAYAFALLIAAAVCILYMFGRRAVYNRLMVARGGSEFSPQPTTAGDKGGDPFGDAVDTFVLWGVFVLQMTVLLAPPILDNVRRLALTPVLLGAWTPLLGWLVRKSYSTRLPLTSGVLAALLALTYWLGENHNVRSTTTGAQRPLGEAARQWMAANGCAGAPDKCPSPIIVAAAGGASRAAFTTVSTLGLLLDATCYDAAHRAPAVRTEVACAEAPMFGRRLFAISGVSGGSVGAAVYAAAYADARRDGSNYVDPCIAHRTTDLWFGGSEPGNWRACLETIAAEDFLSPVFAGLGFRDVLSFLGRVLGDAWEDRGARIEAAMADAYAAFALPDKAPRDSAGFAQPFLRLGPDRAASTDWRPVLLLNATSTETGRRVVQSQLAPTYETARVDAGMRNAPPCLRLFSDAYDLHELFGDGATGAACAASVAGPDLKLAAAAHNSARFPFVSPVGAVRVGDRTVGRLGDGGYFDNYGAQTVYDLAETLRWEFGLVPFVLLITNDPDDAALSRASGGPWYSQPPASKGSPEHVWAPFFSAPLDTILATRSGHGSTAVSMVRSLVDPAIWARETAGGGAAAQASQSKRAADRFDPTCFGLAARDGLNASEPCFAHIAIRGQAGGDGKVKAVSMSWWLSKPVQQFINATVAGDPYNYGALWLVCAAVMRAADPSDPQGLAGAELCRGRIPVPAPAAQ